jgi:hypothetical protein
MKITLLQYLRDEKYIFFVNLRANLRAGRHWIIGEGLMHACVRSRVLTYD